MTGLRQHNFAVDHAADGEEGLDLALTGNYDAAVIDIMLPKLDGFGLIEQLRKQKVNTPVLILSAKRSVDDRVRGLRTGSDDYLTKPFAFSELVARIQALIRRASGAAEPTCLEFEDLSMDLLTREVIRGGRTVDLQAREFSLLEYMMRNTGIVLSRTLILEHIWGYNFQPQTNVVDVLVFKLRSKIDRHSKQKIIQTVRGAGYVLKVQ